MKMQCNCISKLIDSFQENEQIRKLYDDFEHQGISSSFSLEKNEINILPHFTFRWRKMKKGKWNSKAIIFNYCPLCGKKIKEK